MRFVLLALFVQNGGSLVMNTGDAEARADYLTSLAGHAMEEVVTRGMKWAVGKVVNAAYDYYANYEPAFVEINDFGKVQAGVDWLQSSFFDAATATGETKREAAEEIQTWANDPENKLMAPGFMDVVIDKAVEAAASAKEVLNDPKLPSNDPDSFVAKFLATDPFEPGPGLQLEIAEQLGFKVNPDSFAGADERTRQLAAIASLSPEERRKIFAIAMVTGEWEPPDMNDLGPKEMMKFVVKEQMTEAFTNFKSFDEMRDATIEQGKKAMMDLSNHLANRAEAARLNALEVLRKQQQQMAELHAKKMLEFQQRQVEFARQEFQQPFKQALAQREPNYLSHSMFNHFE